MKIIISLLSLVLLSSCFYSVPKYADEKTFEQIGKSTNCDILKEFNKQKGPEKRILSDNKKYWYDYPIGMTFVFENDILCGVSYQDRESIYKEIYGNRHNEKPNVLPKIKGKNLCTHKEWDITLSNEWKDSKYRYLEMPMKPEINLKDISGDEFLNKIRPGMKKGELFRLLGKPDHSYENKDGEWWRYTVDKMFYAKTQEGFMGLAGTKLRYNGRSTLRDFVVVLKNDTVVDRYTAIQAEMTEQEKSCMGDGLKSLLPGN